MSVRRRRRRGTEPRAAGTARARRRGRGMETRAPGTARTRRRGRGMEPRAAGTTRTRRRGRGTETWAAGAARARRRRRGMEPRAAGAAARNGNLGHGNFLRGGAGRSRPAQDGDSRYDKNDAGKFLLVHGKTSLSAIVQCPLDTGELDFGKFQSPLLAAAPTSTPRRSMAPPIFNASWLS